MRQAFIWTSLAALTLAGCAPGAVSLTPTATPSPVDVQTTVVKAVKEAHTIEYAGVVKPWHVVTVATRATGTITEVNVDEGDRVEAGQVLARVDMRTTEAQTGQAQAAVSLALSGVAQSQESVVRAEAGVAASRSHLPELQAQLREAQAGLEQARIDQHRYAEMYRLDAAPRATLDKANTDLKAAQARVQAAQAGIGSAQADIHQAQTAVAEAQANVRRTASGVDVAQQGVAVAASDLPYGVLTAPFHGTVIRRMAHAGDLATPGRGILELQDTRRLHLEVNVPEEAMQTVRPGTWLSVSLDALHGHQTGRVTELIPSADDATHTVLVKISLTPQSGLVPGLYGRVEVPTGAREVIRLAPSLLVQRGDLTGVFAVDHDRAALRWLRLGSQAPAGWEVLSGLEAGDTLITSPLDKLQEGVPVTTHGH